MEENEEDAGTTATATRLIGADDDEDAIVRASGAIQHDFHHDQQARAHCLSDTSTVRSQTTETSNAIMLHTRT